MFDTESNVQHNLILVTDGRNTTGDADLAGAVEAAEAAGMHVFTIGLAGPATDEATLRALASRNGGPTRRSHLMSSVPSTRGSHASSPANTWWSTVEAPFGTAIRTSVHLPVGSASVGFLAPGASGLRPRPEQTPRPGFWAGSVGMGLIALLTFLTVGALGLASLRLDARRRREQQLRSRLTTQPVEHGWDAEAATGRARGHADAAHVLRRPPRGREQRRSTARPPARACRMGDRERRVPDDRRDRRAPVRRPRFRLASAPGHPLELAAFAPFAVLSNAAGRRLAAIQGQLADTLMVIASSMRAGHSFLQSLDSAAKEIDQPAAGEFGRVLREIRLGRDTDDALEALVERVGSQDLEWAVTAIEVQRKIGGNLAEVLETVANTIRERDTLRRQMRVLSAESRISVVVLTVLPILIAIYLMIVNPEYLRTLTTTTPGKIISISALALMGIGYLWMKRITKLDV